MFGAVFECCIRVPLYGNENLERKMAKMGDKYESIDT